MTYNEKQIPYIQGMPIVEDDKKKLDAIKNIYWDYDINPEYYLRMANHPEKANSLELKRFFVRRLSIYAGTS